jgi:acetate kinase
VKSQRILVANTGSSSLKAELFECGANGELRSVCRGAVTAIGTAGARLALAGGDGSPGRFGSHEEAFEPLAIALLEAAGASGDACLAACGHRIVHGGAAFTSPVRVDEPVLRELDAASALAPLHNPPALAVLRAAARRFPATPQVAVFDTAFFAALPEHARYYGVPREWQRAGVRRFGFHGIAHDYLRRRVAEAAVPEAPPSRLVTLQLGAGCSACAQRDGRPVDVSMGYTPLEGLLMPTRCGDLDAGVVLERVRRGETADEIEQALSRRGGLLGLSGASDDVRELLELERAQHAGAALALAAFCQRVRKYLGAYAAVLGGLEAVAFGGGIGEHSAELRGRICAGLEWLGVELDPAANRAVAGGDARISSARSAVAVHVVAVREELLIAEAASACVASDPNVGGAA